MTRLARPRRRCRALLDAGARIVGKTHTDEMTYSLNGENAHYGTPVNVNAPGRIPGGSSSGSAAAVAAGLVDFALGSDTGGSVRAPASFCGIYGLRPTHGRISLEGACALAASFDTVGWFARDPALLERVGRVLLRDDAPASPPGACCWRRTRSHSSSAAVADALQPAVAARYRAAGHAANGHRSPGRPAAVVSGFSPAAGRGSVGAAPRLDYARQARVRAGRARALRRGRRRSRRTTLRR